MRKNALVTISAILKAELKLNVKQLMFIVHVFLLVKACVEHESAPQGCWKSDTAVQKWNSHFHTSVSCDMSTASVRKYLEQVLLLRLYSRCSLPWLSFLFASLSLLTLFPPKQRWGCLQERTVRSAGSAWVVSVWKDAVCGGVDQGACGARQEEGELSFLLF